MSYPIKTKRGEEDAAKVNKYLGRKNYKDGGAVKDDKGTNIHISINAAPKPGPGGIGGPPDPALASALAQAAAPPPMPPPGMAGPPGMDPSMMGGGPPPPMGGGAGPISMRRGGRVRKGTGEPDADDKGGESTGRSKTNGDKIRPTHAPVPPPARKKDGGSTSYPQLTNESGGGYGGLGRLRKSRIAASHK